jgi:hypothetical protein
VGPLSREQALIDSSMSAAAAAMEKRCVNMTTPVTNSNPDSLALSNFDVKPIRRHAWHASAIG